jgi:signal transduction histidine kinase
LTQWIESLPKHRFLIALVLGSAGFAANLLHVPLFFNIDLLFGGIFVMLALQLCGLGGGLLAAVIASSATWLIWNHPYALLVFSVEVIFTGLLFRRWRGNLMLANTLYWLIVGIPLAYVLHQYVMHLGHELSMVIMLKQAINGIANVIVARMAAIWLQGLPRFYRLFPQPVGFQERISTLLALFVMVTSLTLLTFESHSKKIRLESRILEQLTGARRQAEQMIAITSADGSKEHIWQHLVVLTKANAAFERLNCTLYGENNNVISSNASHWGSMPLQGGQVTRLNTIVSYWQPDTSSNLSVTASWKQSFYFTALQTQVGLLVIQTATAAWFILLLNNLIKSLMLILILFLLTLLPCVAISKRINRALFALGETCSLLPSRIEAGQQPDWPRSSIPEIQTLIKDLRQMALALGQALTEKQAGLKRLQAESARRENLEELLIEQRQQDRLHISRELHDDIGQSLQAIKLNLQVHLQECLKNNCLAQDMLQGLVTDVEKTADDLRTVVISLRQAKDGKLCLCDALQSLTDRFGQNRPEPIQLQCSGPVELLPDEIGTALFFVAQEAIANAVKHAAASTIEVTLTVADQTVTLVVRDDGCGSATAHADGAGIPIMQERARLVGGTLSISSLPESGTTILFEVPLP